MPGIDLILPPLNTPVVAQLRPMQSPVAPMGGPAPYVPQSNAGERSRERGQESLVKGLVNILDNAFDQKTREKRRGDISELKERADVSEANLREDLPGKQARVAGGRADLDLQTSAARSKFNLPELEAKAAGARAVAAEKGAAQDAADTDALGTVRQAAERARLELAAASDAYEKADLDLQNNPEDKAKRKAFEQSSRELQLKSKELQNRYDQLRVDEAEYDLSPEGRQARAQAAATKNAPKIEAPKTEEYQGARKSLGLAKKAARASDLLNSPQVQKDLETRIGFWDRNFSAVAKMSPETRELIQIFSQLSNNELKEQSGAAVSEQEYDRFKAATGDMDQFNPDVGVFTANAARSLQGWLDNQLNNYAAFGDRYPHFRPVDANTVRQLALKDAAKNYRGGSFYVPDEAGRLHDLSKDPVRVKALRDLPLEDPIVKAFEFGSAPETSAAAPQAPARPSVTPAQVQQAYDQKINNYLQGTSDPSSYPPGLLNFLNGVMGAPEGVPLESLPGHRIRFDEKTRRIIVVPDRTP